MLDSISDQIDEKHEDDDDDTEELENRLDILRGDIIRWWKTIRKILW